MGQVMKEEKYFLELDENAVLKLPYCGPSARRIYIILKRKNKETTVEIFVQRRDAFTTDLIHAIGRLRNREISEIRYACGTGDFVRIYLNDKERLSGEILCKYKSAMDYFKEKLELP